MNIWFGQSNCIETGCVNFTQIATHIVRCSIYSDSLGCLVAIKMLLSLSPKILSATSSLPPHPPTPSSCAIAIWHGYCSLCTFHFMLLMAQPIAHGRVNFKDSFEVQKNLKPLRSAYNRTWMAYKRESSEQIKMFCAWTARGAVKQSPGTLLNISYFAAKASEFGASNPFHFG